MGSRVSGDVSNVDDPGLTAPFFPKNQAPTRWAKRGTDIVVATAALIFLSPLIIVVAMIVRLQDGGPAFFAQKRIGRNGKTFMCFKVRSMVPDAEERLKDILADDASARREWEETQKLTNDERVTPFGNFLRKSSIDELPQLLNVLRGEMSMVGPRPIIEAEVPRYAEYFTQYCSVSPGLTGLWQVEGRSDTTYEERVQLDVEYARTRSFWGDIKILLMTLPAVLRSRGAR
jgi:lipopolysaccharide/colanic/teichoic acid biosynthesis glycosyltransferase